MAPPAGGIPVGRMAFALITKQGKKTQVNKIHLRGDSKLVQATQERMRLEEEEREQEKKRM